MPRTIRELEITLGNGELNIRNFSAQPEDVLELEEYLQSVGISISEKQFSLCG